uniref:Uncharacterized protein n=1 Tax=Pavo cristatus TaxID=9049 RepID=A0A8C9EGW4_PAVCR
AENPGRKEGGRREQLQCLIPLRKQDGFTTSGCSCDHLDLPQTSFVCLQGWSLKAVLSLPPVCLVQVQALGRAV